MVALLYARIKLSFLVQLHNEDTFAETYYSIGGGFVIKEGEDGNKTDEVVLRDPKEILEEMRKLDEESEEILKEIPDIL